MFEASYRRHLSGEQRRAVLELIAKELDAQVTLGQVVEAADSLGWGGGMGELSIRELADTVIEITGSKSKIEHRPLPADDPVQRCPDISLAREVLKWEPQVPLVEGLGKTVAYFDELLKSGA